MGYIKSVEEVAYHRNGVSGEPFYAVRFTDIDGPNMLATVFDAEKHVAVICIDKIAEHGVAFARNSWRGDRYETELRAAIKAHQDAEDARFEERHNMLMYDQSVTEP